MGWSKHDAVIYNTIISASAIFGIVCGALVGGRLITGGRRRIVLLFNLLNAIAVTMTMFMNLPLICVGRFLFGFCSGVV